MTDTARLTGPAAGPHSHPDTEPARGLYAALLEHPGDPVCMRVLSDALEEVGEMSLAEAYRWAADRTVRDPGTDRGHWPFQHRGGKDKGCWDWYRDDDTRYDGPRDVEVNPACLLPWDVWKTICRLPDRRYGTVHDAFVLLARALAEIERQGRKAALHDLPQRTKGVL